MLIHQLSKKSGVSIDTIRYYTKLGILPVTQRPAGSRSYSDYNESALEYLTEIRLAKSAGFTLMEIKQYIKEWNDGQITPDTAIDILRKKIAMVRKKKSELDAIEAILKSKITQLRPSLHCRN